jgi:16S rRNA processing protein RimM
MDYLGKEVLIPISRAIVLRADGATKTLHTNLPDGLLEIYTTESKPKAPRVPKWRKDKPDKPVAPPAPTGEAPAPEA